MAEPEAKKMKMSNQASSNSKSQTTGNTTTEERLLAEARQFVYEHGVAAIREFVTDRISTWKDVKLNIAVTGACGVGKSAFVNAVRGLNDYDEGAAKVDVIEQTATPEYYHYPSNQNVILCDLPGLDGARSYRSFEEYCKEMELEKFDAFLVLTKDKFTKHDLQLAEKVSNELCKPFLFIHTNVDTQCQNDMKSKGPKFDREVMLKKIRDNCYENLEHLVESKADIFLIDNYAKNDYDFDSLIDAIGTVLPDRGRECFILSLSNVTRNSLKRKAELLRGRIWMIACLSAAGAVVPLPGLSAAVDFVLIQNEVSFYKSQLGLPDKISDEYRSMSSESQEKILKYCLTGIAQLATLLADFTTESTFEEYARFIPIVGPAIAGGLSFSLTHHFLSKSLRELETAALEFLKRNQTSAKDEFNIN